LASPDNVTPQFSLGLFDLFTPREQDLDFSRYAFLTYAHGLTYRGRPNG
jgi:hypothetical protein